MHATQVDVKYHRCGTRIAQLKGSSVIHRYPSINQAKRWSRLERQGPLRNISKAEFNKLYGDRGTINIGETT